MSKWLFFANLLCHFGINIFSCRLSIEGHQLWFAALEVFLPMEAHFTTLDAVQLMVEKGNAMGVAAQISNDLLRSGTRFLGVDHPRRDGYLITSRAASGVKLAGMQDRRYIGTSEVIAVL